MTITLATAATIAGVAATASAVTYTIFGDEVGASADSFKVLAQGQLGTSAATLYTAPASTATITKTIVLANTTASTVAVTMYVGGTTAANSIGNLNIPGNGEAMWAGDGWKLLDGNSAVPMSVASTLTGDVTGSGVGTITTTLAAVGTAGTYGDGYHTPVITTDTKGRITAVTPTVIPPMTGWLDVTMQPTPVTPANAAATNVTNLNTILSGATAGSTIYFPPGTYSFNAGLTTLTKDFVFRGVRGQTNIALSANLAGNFITLDNTGYYTTFKDLSFNNFVTQTAGYVIEAQNDVNVLIQDCFFVGSSGATLAGVVDFTGTNSGNGAVIRNAYMAGFTGVGVNVSSPLDTMYLQDLEIVNNNGGSSSVGIQFLNGGAALLVDCQIINCGVNISLSPTTGNTVSAVFASNCFFDQGRTNSLLITGAGTVARSHFTTCWFTLASTATSGTAVSIATTGSSAHSGLLFSGCYIINTPTATTSNGLVATAAADLMIQGCKVSGWVNGISVTASANASTVLNISGNIIGPSGGVAANTTGIVLNSGTSYGSILISGNTIAGNTNSVTDNAVMVAGGQKAIQGNVGLVVPRPVNVTATTISTTAAAVTQCDSLGGLPIPANVRPGTTIRITIALTSTATTGQATTISLHFGTANTSSDTTILSQALTAASGTVAAGALQVVWTIYFLTSTTAIAFAQTMLSNATNAIAGANQDVGATAPVTIATSALSYLGAYAATATASVAIVRAISYEVVSQ